jgi:hypothetical protein
MDTYDSTTFYPALYGAKPYWDLYVSASLVLLAYHSCEPGRKPVPAVYDRTAKQYICPDCESMHSTRIGESDHLLSPVSDRGYYIGYMD